MGKDYDELLAELNEYRECHREMKLPPDFIHGYVQALASVFGMTRDEVFADLNEAYPPPPKD